MMHEWFLREALKVQNTDTRSTMTEETAFCCCCCFLMSLLVEKVLNHSVGAKFFIHHQYPLYPGQGHKASVLRTLCRRQEYHQDRTHSYPCGDDVKTDKDRNPSSDQTRDIGAVRQQHSPLYHYTICGATRELKKKKKSQTTIKWEDLCRGSFQLIVVTPNIVMRLKHNCGYF